MRVPSCARTPPFHLSIGGYEYGLPSEHHVASRREYVARILPRNEDPGGSVRRGTTRYREPPLIAYCTHSPNRGRNCILWGNRNASDFSREETAGGGGWSLRYIWLKKISYLVLPDGVAFPSPGLRRTGRCLAGWHGWKEGRTNTDPAPRGLLRLR
jgi:hypothetical protein